MKNALKGALWSGLGFPGLGQIVLKHRRRGVVIICAVLACIGVIVVKAAGRALAILAEIESTGEPISMKVITAAATQASAFSGNLLFKLLFLALLFCWGIGIADAFLIGKKMDHNARTAVEAANPNFS